MKIAMCASEMVPFAKSGGLADVLGALPVAIESWGHEVIVIMPRYAGIMPPGCKIEHTKEGVPFATVGRAIRVYFIEHDAYFGRAFLYGDKAGDYPDNLERFAYYSRKAIELLKTLNFKPRVIHCHDWQSALVPVYLKNTYRQDPFYKDSKSVLTIHNLGYQGICSGAEFVKLGLPAALFTMSTLEFFGKVNPLKGGIIFADTITTVSSTYSREIQQKELGFGLDEVLSQRRKSLCGILNGLDYGIWNPESDEHIVRRYSLKNMYEKVKNKAGLLKECGLPFAKEVPVFGMVLRLVQQKGLDIIAESMEEICKRQLQLVILGLGDAKYQDLLSGIARAYPKTVYVHCAFNDPLAHKIYAGADVFLMPSRYEPCGLEQMISLSYGTPPLVYKTGGLADTVNKDNGFCFETYTSADLVAALDRALAAFKDQASWTQKMHNAMRCNFSWETSARQYIQLYEKAA